MNDVGVLELPEAIGRTVFADALLRAEQTEWQAYRSFFAVAAGLHGPEAFRTESIGGGGLLISPPLRRPGVFNRMLGTMGDSWLNAPRLRGVVQQFDRLGCRPALECPALALDDRIRADLREAQFRRGAAAVVLECRLDEGRHRAPGPTRVTDLQVAPVATARERAAAAALCAQVFNVPASVRDTIAALHGQDGWTLWLASFAGRPAGAALSRRAGSTGWFGWAATLPAFRGRGVKGALDDARLRAAEEAGCERITTDTSPDTPTRPDPSMRSLCRRGFRPLYVRYTYLPVVRMAAAA